MKLLISPWMHGVKFGEKTTPNVWTKDTLECSIHVPSVTRFQLRDVLVSVENEHFLIWPWLFVLVGFRSSWTPSQHYPH